MKYCALSQSLWFEGVEDGAGYKKAMAERKSNQFGEAWCPAHTLAQGHRTAPSALSPCPHWGRGAVNTLMCREGDPGESLLPLSCFLAASESWPPWDGVFTLELEGVVKGCQKCSENI